LNYLAPILAFAPSVKCRPNYLLRLGAVFILLLGSTSVFSEETTWPKFQNGGVSSTSAPLPVEWAPEKNIAWSAEIPGYGQSTPIFAHDQIVVTSTSGEEKDNYHVISYSKQGDQLWQVDLKNPSPFKNSPMVSRAAPSAVATKDGFVAFFEGGLVVSLTGEGKQIWQRDLVEAYGKIEARHGLASSLEQDGQAVFVWVERSEDPYLLALDLQNGETIWKSEGLDSTSWSSPRLIPVGEKSHLVCSAIGKIVGFDPNSGKRLWEFEGISNNSSCTPVPAGNGQFLIGASDGRGESKPGAAAASNGLIEIVGDDQDGFSAQFKWSTDKATSTFGSPVVAGDSALIVNRVGVVYQYDLESGIPLSAHRSEAGGVWATPIVNNDLLYLFGYKGTTSVISLESGKELAVNRLWAEEEKESQAYRSGGVLYAATPVSTFLVLRRGDRLYAVGGTETTSKIDQPEQ